MRDPYHSTLRAELISAADTLPAHVRSYLWVRVLISQSATPLLREYAVRKLAEKPDSWWQ